MSTVVYFSTLALLVGTVLLVFAMRYGSAAFAARARAAQDEAYRALAEKVAASQAETEAALAAIRADLAKAAASIAAVETILKQVG